MDSNWRRVNQFRNAIGFRWRRVSRDGSFTNYANYPGKRHDYRKCDELWCARAESARPVASPLPAISHKAWEVTAPCKLKLAARKPA